MSLEDQKGFYNNDVYFAPRRLAGGINWEKTSIFDTQTSFWLSGICQIDLNETDEKIHSQYLAVKFAYPMSDITNFEFGAALELMEETGRSPRAAFIAAADIQWLFHGNRLSMLTIGGRFSSGEWGEMGDIITAFTPLTGIAKGRVLRPNISGIALLQADYTTRLQRGLFMEIFAAYLFRTDTIHFASPGIDPVSDSPFLGAEIFMGISWAAFSDLIFSVGGGLFLPQLGNVFTIDTAIKYRLELMAGISL
jgi:hypothetical protein